MNTLAQVASNSLGEALARTSWRPTKTRPFAKPSEAAEAHRQQDLAAYRAWLARHPNHRDALHVASLIRALQRGPWDTRIEVVEDDE